MRPTWEHMLVCTQLNFDAIDFSEIPQTRVEELRRTVEKDTYAACAMVLKSRCNPPEDAPVEHGKLAYWPCEGHRVSPTMQGICTGDQRSEVVSTLDLWPRQRDATAHLADEQRSTPGCGVSHWASCA